MARRATLRRLGRGLSLLAVTTLVACDGDESTHGSGGSSGKSNGGRANGGTANGGSGGSGGIATSGGASSGGTVSGGGGAAAGSGGTAGGSSAGSGGTAGGGGIAGGSSGRSSAGGAGSSSGNGGTAGYVTSSGGAGGESGESGAPSSGTGGSSGSSGSSGTGGSAGTNHAGAGGTAGAAPIVGLSWPVDCIPGDTCLGIGYPDVDEDGDAFDCGEPGYFGHQGTDINITIEAQQAGTDVWAAADGVVLFAFDGKFDQCPDDDEPDCQAPSSTSPGATEGTTVCTPLGPYCGVGVGSCWWCFAGGNVIVIRHTSVPGVFATRYDHLKRSSVLVSPGDTVTRGQKIAEAASAGASTAPHLHFEVWGTGFYELTEPWAGPCGPNTGPSLWAHDPPWAALLP